MDIDTEERVKPVGSPPYHMEPPMCYASVYNVERCYGGPEEGGWYYDHLDFCFAVPCWSEDEYDQVRDRLCKRIASPTRPIYSVLSDGETRVLRECYPGEIRTDRRPHYE